MVDKQLLKAESAESPFSRMFRAGSMSMRTGKAVPVPVRTLTGSRGWVSQTRKSIGDYIPMSLRLLIVI